MSGALVHLPALVVAVPLAAAPLVLLLRDRTLAWAAALAASLCAFGLAVLLTGEVRAHGAWSYAVGSWPAPYGIELRADAFASLILLIVTGASTAGLAIARASLTGEIAHERQHLFYTAWLLALAGLAGIAVARDAFNIFVFMEISSLATYVMIAGGPRRQALAAVFKYLIMGTIGATFYLIGVGLIYMMTGTLNLADMSARLGDAANLRPVLVAAGFITVGLALKGAIFPLHLWLPGAYTHAPHAATVFIAACSTKVALLVLLRFDFLVFRGNAPDHEAQFEMFLLPLAVMAMLAASAIAIFQRDLKRMLAYSSVAQVGYIVFGASLASTTGLTAAIVHMFNHALAKGTLFLAAACIGIGGAAVTFERVAGAGRRMPIAMAAFAVGAFSLIGIPGTAGFVGKWYLVLATLEHGVLGIWLLVPVLASSLLTLVYMWRVMETAYFEPAAAGAGTPVPAWMVSVVVLGALGNLYFGLQPELPLELAGRAAEGLLETSAAPQHPFPKH
jgi:multicomponent Na+:H+ antiporter subunit D